MAEGEKLLYYYNESQRRMTTSSVWQSNDK
jgi:hypothetical protein